MPQHESLLGGEAPAPASCGGLGARAQLALMLLCAVAMGVQLGLMFEVASDEAAQAHAVAPQTQGGSAMAYCVICDVDSHGAGLPDGSLPGMVTSALKKGCTLIGGVAGGGQESTDFAQAMLCPEAMVGTTAPDPSYPAGVCSQLGNLGTCVTV